MILIFSIIDILGWMAYGDMSVKKRFTYWLDTFATLNNSVSSLDLYSARCGVLHTMTPKSDLSKKLKAKQLYYSWGDSSSELLKESIKLTGKENVSVIHINELFEIIKVGYNNFKKSTLYFEYIKLRKELQFSNIEKDVIDDYLIYRKELK